MFIRTFIALMLSCSIAFGQTAERDTVVVEASVLGPAFNTHLWKVVWTYENHDVTEQDVKKFNQRVLAILKEETQYLGHRPSIAEIRTSVNLVQTAVKQIRRPLSAVDVEVTYLWSY